MPHGIRTDDGEQANVERQQSRRAYTRDITDLFPHGFDADGHPLPANPKRRAKYGRKGWLSRFCRYYFPEVFFWPMTRGQRDDLAITERAIRRGGNFAIAAPRGDGKTARSIAPALYALLYGFRGFFVIVGSDLPAAKEIFESCKTQLRINERLREDFPEVCIPAMAADDVALRANLLSVHNENVHMKWSKDLLIFPALPGSVSSNALLCPRGLTGRLRGMFHTLEDGTHKRPDFFLLDDPQTDESAKSPQQCRDRQKFILGAVMGAGGKDRIAALMPGTVIVPGDLMHQMLDHEKHPDWQGRKRSMIVNWPDAQETLWVEYMDIRRTAQREGDPEAKAATAFYRKRRKAMDKGAMVDNPHRRYEGELSALQHAENLLCDRGKEVFYAEYQNEPEQAQTLEYVLDAETVASRTNGVGIRAAPDLAHFVCGFIDINHYGLHWTMAAFQQNLTGFVVDYGRFPGGGGLVVSKGASPSEAAEQVFAALSALLGAFGRYELTRPNGRTTLDLLLVDCGYMPDVVFQFCRQAHAPFRIMASRGAGSRKYRQARVIGSPRDNCHETEWGGKGNVVVHNADYWRSNTQRAFLKEPGHPGSLSLYGDDARTHGDFGRHIAAERLVRFIAASASVPWNLYEWSHVPGEIWDWLDSTVGCVVGAAMLGASLGGVVKMPRRAVKPKRRKAKVRRDA